MATSKAIAATGAGIVKLLDSAYQEAEFGALPAAFEVYQPKQFQGPMDFGLSLLLYRVNVNAAARNPRPLLGRDGLRRLPPLPVDLSYLLTAWAATAEDQHALLGWAMRVLEDTPILPPAWLNSAFPGTFGPTETVELSPDQVGLQDMVALWDLMKPNQQPSVAYVARMVALESTVTISEHAPVQTRVVDAGKLLVPA